LGVGIPSWEGQGWVTQVPDKPQTANRAPALIINLLLSSLNPWS